MNPMEGVPDAWDVCTKTRGNNNITSFLEGWGSIFNKKWDSTCKLYALIQQWNYDFTIWSYVEESAAIPTTTTHNIFLLFVKLSAAAQ